jgi:hypothetical protein
MPTRPKLTYANVMSTVAVFLVVSGAAAYAAIHLPKNSVGSKQLKQGAVKAGDLANNSVTSAKVAQGSLKPEDFAAKQLPAGPPGQQGPPGADATKLFAAVSDTDNLTPAVLEYSHGVTGFSDPGPEEGGYIVTFAQSVTDCVVEAVAGFGDPSGTATGLYSAPFVNMAYGDSRQVEVSFQYHDGSLVDTSFMVAAFC